MTYSTVLSFVGESQNQSRAGLAMNPRQAMHARLPSSVQPFLTWLTAQPVPGEPVLDRSPLRFVSTALLQTLLGAALSVAALHFCLLLLPIGLLITTSGLGLFQVVVFHHCSHGTVFKRRDPAQLDRNTLVGRLISALLLFKHFDHYKHGHMLHHSNNKLLTEEDEFADFVFNTCKLEAGVPHWKLRRRVLVSLVSPRFHSHFAVRRVRAAWLSHDREHNLIGAGSWAALAMIAFMSGQGLAFLVALVLPVTVLLQIATVGRILCEHSFPEVDLIEARGKDFAAHATSGVFPGVMPPAVSARSAHGLLRWTGWWANMLTVQLFMRLFVLVGDAPCHDYHHRKPASRRWTSYIQARQHDVEAVAATPRTGYSEIWGLVRAVDGTLASLSRLPPGTVI
jgi:fatty acid desaturase